MPEDPNVLLPQWAIAVICIGFISLMFVIVFGVTVVSITFTVTGIFGDLLGLILCVLCHFSLFWFNAR
jgi:hypothetical protein